MLARIQPNIWAIPEENRPFYTHSAATVAGFTLSGSFLSVFIAHHGSVCDTKRVNCPRLVQKLCATIDFIYISKEAETKYC